MGDAFLRLRKYKDAIEVLEKALELARPEDVIYEAIGHCYDRMGNFAQARFNYKKATHLSQGDSQLHYKIACTYMNEGNWNNAIKNLEVAMRTHRLQPEYNLAMGQCFMEMGNLDDAITYFGNVVRVRPKNLNGWIELLKCLYKATLFEEALEYANFAFEQTDGKPIFLFYKSAILFALGKSKEATLQLEMGMEKNPKLVKKIIELNPAILQSQQVVDVLARFKKKKSH
jgi:tetratricopeptide (TPR) repeat protein